MEKSNGRKAKAMPVKEFLQIVREEPELLEEGVNEMLDRILAEKPINWREIFTPGGVLH